MQSTITTIPDGTIELTITIPWTTVQTGYTRTVDHAVEHAEIAGFRKGKAPRDLVEKNLDRGKLYEEALKTLIPDAYNQAVKEHSLTPIITPQVELKEAQEGKDWVLLVRTCQKPNVVLGDYKKAIRELKGGKIWKPGDDEKAKKPTLEEFLSAITSTLEVTIPSVLLENQVQRQLSDLIDQTRKVGLTIEQYLTSTNRTAQSLRKEHEEQAKKTLALEFGLEEIADREGILISDDDIDAVIKTAKTEEEKKALESQRYYLASVLRRQKTIDALAATPAL